ncbi:MAG: hemin-degrading factor [Rhizobium sp. 63-7]|nr:MAG: hemin-degrading factor [Rhizobium sp. 63-7]
MTETKQPTPAEIRAYRAENPKLRERDLAANLCISEAALVAAETGLTVTRIDASPNRLLERVKELGEVMALTRNESAVHEKIGVFETIKISEMVSLTLGENMDMRIFNKVWAHGFAVTKKDGEQERLSLQYFDKAGDAVFKLHLRPASDVAAYHAIVSDFRIEDQSQDFVAEEITSSDDYDPNVTSEILREHWSQMTDTHQFFGMLKKLKIARQTAVRIVGQDYAWQLAPGAVTEMLNGAAAIEDLPIMVFVANRGMVQIHGGPVSNIQAMGPWINVLDPSFHLHLRQDHIAEAWAVRKPTADGTVTSVEAFNAKGEMIIQFFGKRQEGSGEREAWRSLVENLPRADASVAA